MPQDKRTDRMAGVFMKRYKVVNWIVYDGEKRLGRWIRTNWIPAMIYPDGQVAQYTVEITFDPED